MNNNSSHHSGLLLSELTPREHEIFLAHSNECLACLSNDQLAEHFEITSGTLQKHINHIYNKTGLQNRSGLTYHAVTQEIRNCDSSQIE